MDERQEEMIALRNERRTMQEIADTMGVSRARVSQILKGSGLSGRLEYPELKDPDTFERPDEVISDELRVPLSRVQAARRKLKIYRWHGANLDERREWFANNLFEAKPGPYFVDGMTEYIEQSMPPEQATLLIDWYLKGRTQDTGYRRSFRAYAKKRLKKKLTDREKLEFFNKGIIEFVSKDEGEQNEEVLL